MASDTGSVLYQIQLLFGYLMKSQKKYYDTMPLCKVLRGFDGQPLPVGEQQDVNEFCARLFDQLEQNLKGSNAEKCIDSAFGGTLTNQMISSECAHKSEREEAFHTVSLTVKNKSSLKESLELYVKGDILDGDNKWLCSECDAKRAALKRSCFGKLSKYLILHLSRFEFDFNAMRRKKLNSRFEFPLNLNMQKYTKEGIAHIEAQKAREKKLDALIAKSEQIEEYEEEIEIEQETKKNETQTIENEADSSEQTVETQTETKENEETNNKKTTKKIIKSRKIELSDSENELLKELNLSLQS